MTREEKIDLVNELTNSFTDANIIICDYKGLFVKDLESLRKAASQADAKVRVVKNTLAGIVFSNLGVKELQLKDNNIFIWSKDQLSLAKFVQKFADTNSEKFIIKSGLLEGKVVSTAHIVEISKLPSKEELLGMLLSVWNAPIRYFVTALDNLKKSKES